MQVTTVRHRSSLRLFFGKCDCAKQRLLQIVRDKWNLIITNFVQASA